MRRKEKQINDPEVLGSLLQTCHTGRLGTNGRGGYPMVKPLNFAHHAGNIYFHTAKQGEKIEDIQRDNRVCFEVDLPIAYVRATNQPCAAAYLFRSVIILGKAHWVEDEAERRFALDLLMQKYQPDGGYGEYLEEKLAITGVIRIAIEEMVGKEHLGQGQVAGVGNSPGVPGSGPGPRDCFGKCAASRCTGRIGRTRSRNTPAQESSNNFSRFCPG